MEGGLMIFGSLGLVIGLGIGIIIGGKIKDNEYAPRIDELEDSRRRLIDENEEQHARYLKEKEEHLEHEAEIVDEAIEKFKESHKITTKKIEELSKAYHDDGFDEHFEEVVGPEDDEYWDDEEDPHGSSIYPISEDEYRDQMTNEDSSQITYWQEDDLLIDERGDIIHDGAKVVGYDMLDILPETESDFLYVKNEYLEILYEITINHRGSYYDNI